MRHEAVCQNPQCGKAFTYRKGTGKFCSRPCVSASKRVTLTCANPKCAKVFTVKASEMKKAVPRRFCGTSCRNVVCCNGTFEGRSRGGKLGAETRFGWFWNRAMDRCREMSPMGAFKWGYKLGYCRKARQVSAAKAKREKVPTLHKFETAEERRIWDVIGDRTLNQRTVLAMARIDANRGSAALESLVARGLLSKQTHKVKRGRPSFMYSRKVQRQEAAA